MVGFVFFPKSPRHLELARARDLAARVEGRAQIVALTVDADDATLEAIVASVAPDLLQLHGRETPERVAAVRARFGLPVMKALGIATADDLARGTAYVGAADRLLQRVFYRPTDVTHPEDLALVQDAIRQQVARGERPRAPFAGDDGGVR